MKTVLKDAFVDGWLDEGRLEKARQMTLQILCKRFSVSDDIRKRVETCTDMAMLDIWFDRAITAASIGEVFAELRVGSSPSLTVGATKRTVFAQVSRV